MARSASDRLARVLKFDDLDLELLAAQRVDRDHTQIGQPPGERPRWPAVRRARLFSRAVTDTNDVAVAPTVHEVAKTDRAR